MGQLEIGFDHAAAPNRDASNAKVAAVLAVKGIERGYAKMKMGFDIDGASPTAPDYRMLRAVLETRALVGRAAARPAADFSSTAGEIAACSFSRAGIAKLLGFDPEDGNHGKDCLNLRGSMFGESGGVVTLGQPGDRADGGQERVQGSYA